MHFRLIHSLLTSVFPAGAAAEPAAAKPAAAEPAAAVSLLSPPPPPAPSCTPIPSLTHTHVPHTQLVKPLVYLVRSTEDTIAC
jgi:hypothetical protein